MQGWGLEEQVALDCCYPLELQRRHIVVRGT